MIRSENRVIDNTETERKEKEAAFFKPRRFIGSSPFKRSGAQTVVRSLDDQLATMSEQRMLMLTTHPNLKK